MTNTYRLGRVAAWAFMLGLASLALSGCKGNAQPQAPPPPEVSVIQVAAHPVTVYNEYVAQTQAPDTIEIRSQVTGLLERQAFTDGARVKKGEVLYIIDQRPFEAQLAQAKASLAQAEANLVNAKQNLARQSRLIAQKAVSQQDYDTAVAQERSGTALVEAQKALLRNVELNLEFATLRAPRDGFMSSSLVKPGALITAQQTLLTTLYSSDPMWVNFSISEDDCWSCRKRSSIRPESNPRRRRRFTSGLPTAPTTASREAQLRRRDDRPEERHLQVRISVPNPDRVLRPGLFVRVIVAAFENPNAIRIPQQAVQELQGLKSVYVVGADDKAEARQIVAGHRIANEWVVDSGLEPGDRVVVEGIGKVKPGSPVKPLVVAADSGAPGATAASGAAASPAAPKK